jgi:sugar phosphate permease
VLAIGMGGQIAYAGVTFGLPALAPSLRDTYDLELYQLGIVLGASNVGMLLCLLLWGLAADHIGERAVIAIGMTGAAGALALASTVDGWAALAAALTAAGSFGASANSASGRAVMHAFGPEERGFALGIRQTAATIGGAVAAVALPMLAGPRASFHVLAVACLVAAAAAAYGLPSRSPTRESRRGRPLQDGRIWRLASGSALVCVGQTCVVSFVALYLHDQHGLSAAAAAGALAAVNVGGLLLRVGAGAWSDRLRKRVTPLRYLAFTFAATLLACAVLVDAPAELVVPSIVLAGALALSWNGLSYTATAELAGASSSGTALGLQQTMLTGAGAATPVVFAASVAATSWRLSFAAATVAPLAGAWLLASLARAEGRGGEDAVAPEAAAEAAVS